MLERVSNPPGSADEANFRCREVLSIETGDYHHTSALKPIFSIKVGGVGLGSTVDWRLAAVVDIV